MVRKSDYDRVAVGRAFMDGLDRDIETLGKMSKRLTKVIRKTKKKSSRKRRR